MTPAFVSSPLLSPSASSTSINTASISPLSSSSSATSFVSRTGRQNIFQKRSTLVTEIRQQRQLPNESVKTKSCLPPLNENGLSSSSHRKVIRIAIPSKGGILDDTKQLLADVGINIQIKNPRQYVASMKGLDAEVWLQRPADIVRKVRDGDIDLGFTGYDLVAEYGGCTNAIVSIHERLAYGECKLAVGIPMGWNDCNSMVDVRKRAELHGLRIATKYKNETNRFMKEYGIENYGIVNMDGALEASTQMGTADVIVDIVSSGTTLRENLLKEIDDGTLLQSSMQLIGNREKLCENSAFGDRLRDLTKEVLERIEAHLLGKNNFNIIANIRGSSMVDVSRRLATYDNLRGVDGPTISPVVPSADSDDGMYAISIVVPKDRLYSAIQQLRNVGGSGVTVMPVSFIFPQKCMRWETLTKSLDIKYENGATPENAATSATGPTPTVLSSTSHSSDRLL